MESTTCDSKTISKAKQCNNLPVKLSGRSDRLVPILSLEGFSVSWYPDNNTLSLIDDVQLTFLSMQILLSFGRFVKDGW